jgi:hypothetical protein
MNVKVSWLICAALLAVAAFGTAAELPPMSPLTSGGSCGASPLAALDLPGLTPQVTPLLTGACGTCSTPVCQGARIGTGCQISWDQTGTCQNVLGNICSGGGGINKCQCWNGPLP